MPSATAFISLALVLRLSTGLLSLATASSVHLIILNLGLVAPLLTGDAAVIPVVGLGWMVALIGGSLSGLLLFAVAASSTNWRTEFSTGHVAMDASVRAAVEWSRRLALLVGLLTSAAALAVTLAGPILVVAGLVVAVVFWRLTLLMLVLAPIAVHFLLLALHHPSQAKLLAESGG